MSRSLYYLFVCFYFGCTLAHSVNSTARSYRFVQKGDTGSYFLQAVHYGTDQLIALPFVGVIASYAGIAVGYGFFAPQVGSSFQVEVDAIDSAGGVVARTSMPIFSHTHNLLRFHSLLNRLQNIQPDPTEAGGWSVRHARALSHCIAQRMARLQWGTRYETIRCTVSAYQHTALRASATINMQRFIIYQRVIPNRYPS